MTATNLENSLVIEGAGMTHVGHVRERNEDAILLDPTGELWAVADGMGGYGHGDVAASIVIDNLTLIDGTDQPEARLEQQITAANAEIYDRAVRAGHTMGTTIVASMILGDVAHVAWVGDSRIYLLRDGTLSQLSKDHSVVQELIDSGFITEEDARHHPDRNIVTRALGVGPTVDVSFATLPMRDGDRILLCSDGLTACLTDADIAVILEKQTNLDELASELVQRTLDRGAPDNVSLIIVSAARG